MPTQEYRGRPWSAWTAASQIADGAAFSATRRFTPSRTLSSLESSFFAKPAKFPTPFMAGSKIWRWKTFRPSPLRDRGRVPLTPYVSGAPSDRPDAVPRRREAEAAAVDDHLSPRHSDPAFREQSHRQREQLVLPRQDPGGQRLLRVVVAHLHRLLQEDGAAVRALVDEVDRAPGDLRPVLQDVLVGVGPGEGRQQGGMYVDHALRELREECRGDEAHEAGEHDEVHALLLERRHDLRLELLARLPAVVDHRHRNPRRFRACDHRRAGHVAHEDGDFRAD